MMGDDLQDLAAIDEVDVFFTTPNALDIVKDNINYLSKSPEKDSVVCKM